MNKIIKINTWKVSDDVKQSINMIMDSLDKDNYVWCKNKKANMCFLRSLPDHIKENNSIMITRKPHSTEYVGVITIKPSYYFERVGDLKFRLRVKKL